MNGTHIDKLNYENLKHYPNDPNLTYFLLGDENNEKSFNFSLVEYREFIFLFIIVFMAHLPQVQDLFKRLLPILTENFVLLNLLSSGVVVILFYLIKSHLI